MWGKGVASHVVSKVSPPRWLDQASPKLGTTSMVYARSSSAKKNKQCKVLDSKRMVGKEKIKLLAFVLGLPPTST